MAGSQDSRVVRVGDSRAGAVPRGLVLFPPGTPRARRWWRLAFLVVYGAAAVGLLWPAFPAVAGRAFPLVLGLPMSLAWILGILTVVFLALLALYLADGADAGE